MMLTKLHYMEDDPHVIQRTVDVARSNDFVDGVHGIIHELRCP